MNKFPELSKFKAMIFLKYKLLQVLHSIKHYFLGIILLLVFGTGCDQTITPITPKGTEYSVYGPLRIGEAPNFIRVHDTNDLLNAEVTKDLDVNMLFTNMATGESAFLKDSVKIFDDLYTHNYEVEERIEFNNRYKFLWEDGDGFKDSLISQTTKESSLTVFPDTVAECGDYFYATLTDIDLEVGEQIEPEAGVQFSEEWYWSFRYHYYEYEKDAKRLTVGFKLQNILCDIFGCFPPPGVSCSDATDNKIRFRFNHIGYMVGEETSGEINLDSLDSSSSLNRQVILSTYSKEDYVIMDDRIFEEE